QSDSRSLRAAPLRLGTANQSGDRRPQAITVAGNAGSERPCLGGQCVSRPVILRQQRWSKDGAGQCLRREGESFQSRSRQAENGSSTQLRHTWRACCPGSLQRLSVSLLQGGSQGAADESGEHLSKAG